MEVLLWTLVGILVIAVIALYVAWKRALATPPRVEPSASPPPPPEAARTPPAGSPPPPAVREPDPAEHREATRVLLGSLLAFLERSPLQRLRDAEEEEGEGLPTAVLDALDALEDLAFYGSIPEGVASRQSLESLVREVTREYAEQHDTRVRVIGPERPVIFEVASEWLKDILYLVLSNADHFGGEDGVEIRLSGGQAVPAVVEVRDRGEGFAPEALAHAIEPFWTTDPIAPGLGLFHCRILMDRMGGELEISNHPEGGGRVRILLPETPPESVED